MYKSICGLFKPKCNQKYKERNREKMVTTNDAHIERPKVVYIGTQREG